jgi:hypothetical protein
MTGDELAVGIRKGLEAWTLQNLCDGAILLMFIALAMLAGRGYLDEIRSRLSLRVAGEIWDVVTEYGADLLLLVIMLIGLMVVNPDVMADIKVALPWLPLAFLLAGVALAIRACHGGRLVGSAAWYAALALVVIGCASAWFGFTFVMEAAGHEYLDQHPSALWESLRNMRSDLNPELNMTVFSWAGPALAFVFLWMMLASVVSTVRGTRRPKHVPADRTQAAVVPEDRADGKQ